MNARPLWLAKNLEDRTWVRRLEEGAGLWSFSLYRLVPEHHRLVVPPIDFVTLKFLTWLRSVRQVSFRSCAHLAYSTLTAANELGP